MKGRHALIVERHLATYENIQDDAKTPHIHFRASVYFCVQELRRRKVQRATERRQMLNRIIEVRQTEVDDLDVPSL